MPPDPLKTVEKCIKDAKEDPEEIEKCETAFTTAGGTVGPQEGGKVFSVGAGTPEIITTGGKVFQHKP